MKFEYNLKPKPKMKKREHVSKIMTTDLVTLQYSDDLITAENLFKKHNIRHIPVVNGNTIIGIISQTDLMRISYSENTASNELDVVLNNTLTLSQVMVKNVVSITSDTLIKEVAEVFASKEFHALPVVDNEKLVGIVTTTDLIKYLLAQF